jgi:hypothetical protein
VEDVVWLSVPRTRKSDTEAEAEVEEEKGEVEAEAEAEISPSIPLPEGAHVVSLITCESILCPVVISLLKHRARSSHQRSPALLSLLFLTLSINFSCINNVNNEI